MLQPNFVEAHNNLGCALERLGQLDEAIRCHRQALQLKPDYPEAWYNLANTLKQQKDFDAAIGCFQQAVRVKPDFADAHNNMGLVYLAQSKHDDAIPCFQAAIRCRPRFAGSHFNLATAYRHLGKFDFAISSYEETLRLQPENGVAHLALGALLEDQGKPEQALVCYGHALRLLPSDRLRILTASVLPVIPQSMDQLEAWRDRLGREIRSLHQNQLVFDLTDEHRRPLFFLAYHGRNDRDIMRQAALLYRAPQPIIEPPARTAAGGNKRIHIGLLSAFFTRHTIGHLTRGLAAQLSREDFHVTVLSVGRHDNEMADAFKQRADAYLEVPRDLRLARQLIAQQRLDILFYADIGIDSFTSTLAFSRLAPVQCVTWGHPVTTGIDTIDYFISSKHLETEGAQQHYTETLVQLQSLPIYYFKPALPDPVLERDHFGLKKDDHVYACPQTLNKFHPEFDELVGGILRGDPRGVLVLIKPAFPHWEQLLRQHLAAAVPDVLGRIRFLPSLARDTFVNLLAVSDVLLDPIHFGGGNTSYQGLAVGTPIVTLPSNFLRGRITFALYQQMNLQDCVAANREDYVKLALRLGTDSDYRKAISNKILESNGVLFENSEGIRELEQFFRSVVEPKPPG